MTLHKADVVASFIVRLDDLTWNYYIRASVSKIISHNLYRLQLLHKYTIHLYFPSNSPIADLDRTQGGRRFFLWFFESSAKRCITLLLHHYFTARSKKHKFLFTAHSIKTTEDLAKSQASLTNRACTHAFTLLTVVVCIVFCARPPTRCHILAKFLTSTLL